jgi:hypothetical protein
MRKIFTVFVCLFYMGCGGDKKEGSIILEGEYRGKNPSIQNPYAENGIGYCMSEVYVNGKMTSDEINAETFEIDLAAMGLKEGDQVKIELRHLTGCTPKILNPEVLE